MTILQISKIVVRTGDLQDLPQLDNGEFGWAADNKRLFIGTDTTYQPNATPQNVEVLTEFSNVMANLANTVVNNAQPNITSVGTLVGLTSGNILPSSPTKTIGTIDAPWEKVFTDRVDLLYGTAPVELAATQVGNIYSLTVNGSLITAGTVSANAQPNITTVGTLLNLTVAGNANVSTLNATGIHANGAVIATSVVAPTMTANAIIATTTLSAPTATVTDLVTANSVTLAPNVTYSGSALAATDTTIAFKIPVTIGGNVYYLALTAAQ